MKDTNKKWKLNNKIVTIAFWAFIISLSILFTSSGFANQSRFTLLHKNRVLIGFIFIIVGLLISFILNKKEVKFKEEMINFIRLKLSRVQVGLLFVYLGIMTLIKVGSIATKASTYLIPGLVVIISFITMIALFIYDNYEMLKRLGKYLLIGSSILSFIIAAILYCCGKTLYAVIVLIVGVIFLALFIYVITAKYRKKKEDKKNENEKTLLVK